MRPLFALAPIAFAGLALPAYAGSITVEGVGEVRAAPDMATISSGVTTQGATAREALDANTAAMAELVATLRQSGIAARDIQTSGFSVSPDYVYSDERDASGYPRPPRINGYQVMNTVTVAVRDLPTLGAILDRAVTVGANTINGVSFSVADPSELYNQARQSAFANARQKAELYAAAAGGSLEELQSISESQGFNQPQPMPMYAMRAEADQATVPVEAGELSFSINVTVQWELDDTED